MVSLGKALCNRDPRIIVMESSTEGSQGRTETNLLPILF